MVFESGFSAVPGSPKLPSIDPATISYLFGISLPQADAACNPQESANRRNLQRRIPDQGAHSAENSGEAGYNQRMGYVGRPRAFMRATEHFQCLCRMRGIQIRILLIS
jgi:hypothetical protein